MISSIIFELSIILLLGHLCEPSPYIINDICQKSAEERLTINYTFTSTIPVGGILSGNYTTFNDSDETVCFDKCCANKLCNIAWHFKRICITFECNLDKFDTCMPKKANGGEFQLTKFFLLRVPVQPTDYTGTPTTSTTTQIPKVTTATSVLTTISSSTKVLIVNISTNQTLTMPINYVTLRATVGDDKNSTYEYQWSLLSKPSDTNSGKWDTTKTDKELKLTDLIVGDYHFEVEVRGNNSYGKADVFVFVKPAKKQNEPPIAVILPKVQTVQLPNNVILDGSKSTDDDKIVSYFWELIKGPMEAEKKIKNDESMLNLENLSAGNYTFKLTVKDAAGLASSDTAYLIIVAEKDYPPLADPGNNIIVELPVKFVILNGSGSRDDKKIVSYQWTKKSDVLTADIQGVREPILNLTNLQEGTYTFNLKVTDSSGQFSDKDVQVFVKPRSNSSPVARASITEDKTVTVRLPATEGILNGSLSSDDEKIVVYQWQQIEGQPKLNLVDVDKPIAYVYDLKIGVFKFSLTVYDKEKLSSSDVVTLRINESKNQKPLVRIVKIPKYYHLETNIIRIDGSNSWDDVKIVQYKWTREDDSLAVGKVLDNSDSASILMLTDLLPGLYKFNLQILDEEGLFDNFVAPFDILPPKYEKHLVELQCICSLQLFTESRKNAFLNNIQSIVQNKLDHVTSRVMIHVVQLEKVPFKHSISIVFYATLNKGTQSTSTAVVGTQKITNGSSTELIIEHNTPLETSPNQIIIQEIYVDALEVVDALSLVRHNTISIEYQIVRVDTYVCQNNCSNHGHCNHVTKLCECESFWTASFIRERYGDGRPNCDWSIIYLVLFIGLMLFVVFVPCWFFLWIRQRKCKAKKMTKTRKHKYVKINDYDYESRMNMNSKVPKSLTNGVKSRMSAEKVTESLLNTDSSLSSEEETVYFNKTNRSEAPTMKRSSSFSSVPMANGNMMKSM